MRSDENHFKPRLILIVLRSEISAALVDQFNQEMIDKGEVEMSPTS